MIVEYPFSGGKGNTFFFCSKINYNILVTFCENFKSQAPVEFFTVDFCTIYFGIF